MDYKSETKKAYNTYPKKFATNFEKYFKILKYTKKEVPEFLKRIPKNSKILDLGCGADNYAMVFKNKGYDVKAIDISQEMVKICKERGLNAQVMDFENLKFPDETFDGVFGYASLFHIPKDNFKELLKQIHIILKPSGIFFLVMRQGKGVIFKEDDRYPNTKRWISLYTKKELEKYLKPYFAVEFYSERTTEYTMMNFILRKI